jgi:hypothetical protein
MPPARHAAAVHPQRTGPLDGVGKRKKIFGVGLGLPNLPRSEESVTAVERAMTVLDTIERLITELKVDLQQQAYTACEVCGLRRPVVPGHRAPRTCGSRCRKRLSRLNQRDAQA